MQLKVLQLNVWMFKYYNEILSFIQEHKPDVILMQEASNMRKSVQENDPIDLLGSLAEINSMSYVFAPLQKVVLDNKERYVGNAVLSKYPIITSTYAYDKYLGDTITQDRNSPILDDRLPKYERYKHNFRQTTNFINAVIKVNNTYARLVTSHFSVSYACTETLQMLQQAEQVVDIIKNSNNLPTIFAADLNIHKNSASVAHLSTVMQYTQPNLTNSLSSIHPAIQNDAPDGLRVDFTFYNDKLTLVDSKTPNLVISDHLPTLSIFELS
jgi:endonuclease/exonuclease/phosphatase family metal-dependent hydrolase